MKQYVPNIGLYIKFCLKYCCIPGNTDIATFALRCFIFTHPVKLFVYNYNDFDTPSTKTIAIDGDFSFVPNYLMRLFYLWKLSKHKYQYKLNKIMKMSLKMEY